MVTLFTKNEKITDKSLSGGTITFKWSFRAATKWFLPFLWMLGEVRAEATNIILNKFYGEIFSIKRQLYNYPYSNLHLFVKNIVYKSIDLLDLHDGSFANAEITVFP